MAKVAGNYYDLVPFRLHGIPCQIGVSHYFVQPPHRGSAWTCDSDWDYYGYTELEYDILDRKGYRARWLEAKGVEHDQVQQAVCDYYNNQ